MGLGAIYVFAAGNGGPFQDSCAYNGYVNSIYTIAITGVNKDGSNPTYAEDCPGIMATTYSRDTWKGYGKVVSKTVSLWRAYEFSPDPQGFFAFSQEERASKLVFGFGAVNSGHF